MFKVKVLILFLVAGSPVLLAQGLFTVPAVACVDQFIDVQSEMDEQETEWDFCARDLEQVPLESDAGAVPGFLGGFGYKAVYDNGSYFAFVPSYAGNILFRLDFGNSLMNNPVVVNLGNPGNLLNKPQSIEVSKIDGLWFALIGYDSQGYGIVQLSFGSSLTNSPTASLLGNFGFSNAIFYDLKLVVEPAGIILVMLDRVGSSLFRVRFDNLINYLPQPEDIHMTSTIPGASSLFSFDVAVQDNQKVVLLSSYFNNRIIQLNFGSTLLQEYLTSSSYTSPLLDQPIRIRLVNEVGRHYALVANNSSSTGMTIIDYNDFNAAPTDVPTSLPALFSVDAVRFNGETILTGLGSTSVVKRFVFKNDCGAVPNFSNTPKPGFITYTRGGIKSIAVKTITPAGVHSYQESLVTVSPDMAPTIDFSIQNRCANHDVTFTPQNASGDITNYDWSFGDSNTSSQVDPTHVFSSAGEYNSTLTVTAANGCQNLAQKSVIIYNQPTVDFSLPATSPLCTNQQYNFSNTSTFDAASNPTWEWSLNGIVVSSTADLLTQFSTDQLQVIKLKSSIPGCESEMVKNISSIQTGPITDFTFSNGCEDVAVSFTNTTTGAVVGYVWDFDDGNTSIQQNAVNTFENAGRYQVKLQATNLTGCQNFASKEITVYSNPQPNFSLDLPPFSCAGSQSQFNDLTPALTDSNITSWSWSFGDAANGTSTQKNPNYTYSTAADYDVSLQVTSNFGCSSSIEKTITISRSPVAEFASGPACINKPTQFTDESGSDVKAWLWTVNNSSYTTKNPAHTFSTTGTQSVMLTVTANNNCVNQTTKAVVVPVPVVADFTYASTCAGTPAVFQEINSGGVDPAVAWNWNFAGQANASTSSAQHIFPNTGNFPVTLTSTRQSGCSYSLTKSILIVHPPSASFTVSTESGAAPLAVGFTNTSTLATSFLWKFNDPNNSTSTDFSPAFVFNQLGSYQVELIASNAAGCSDNFTETIQVVVPEINAVLSDFILSSTPDGGKKATVTIENKSNITIVNPEVYIDLAGNALIREQLSATILPGQSITRMLTADIIPRDLTYACAEVKVLGDSFQFDNRACLNLTSEPTYLQPYPNPAQSQLFLDWINENQESLQVVIYNSSGQIAMNRKYNLLPGLNQVLVDVNDLATGIYFVSYSDGRIIQSFRFSIAR